VTVERDAQPEKQSEQIVSTDEGMTIDESVEKFLNKAGRNDNNREPRSNVTIEKDLQISNQPVQSGSSVQGIQIDELDGQTSNTLDSIYDM
jgi:hypothetical protein